MRTSCRFIAGLWLVAFIIAPWTWAATATQPADTGGIHSIVQINLPTTPQGQPSSYRLALPAGYAPSARPPLLICLHGTDDGARQAMAFWSALHPRVPMVVAAPQACGRGWGNDDVPGLRACLADLDKRVSYDRRRVLLAGFSAGGAMSLHLLYAEQTPVTAAAALANYVPPNLRDGQIRRRAAVPVFYAVGSADVNHEPMRAGLRRLRSAGADVYLYRPRIGHVLDAAVAEAALEWFFTQSARRLNTVIEEAAGSGRIADSAILVEEIIAQSRWYEPAQVAKAEGVLRQIEAAGRRELLEARGWSADGRPVDAVALLRKIEADYGPAWLGREARGQRERLEADPAVSRALAEAVARQRAERAFQLYMDAQRMVEQRQFAQAADRCTSIMRTFGDTPLAARAKVLLERLSGSGSIE